MIYITGDIHGEPNRLNKHSFYEQDEMTKNDYVIILGDFGLIWDKEMSKNEKYWLNWLDEKPFTTLFIDGNHENHKRLNSYDVEIWNGGKIHKINNSVFHLMRGQVFEIDNKKIFTFGGARSHDIQGGVLDTNDKDYPEKLKKAKEGYLPFRIKDLSWWEEEMPSKTEMAEGLINLEKNNNEVDYILTHCCASSTQALYSGGFYEPDELTKYFDDIRAKVKFKKWFFGHYHDNKMINTEEYMLYEQIIRIS